MPSLPQRLKAFLRDPYYRLQAALVPEREYILNRFQRNLGYPLNLENPRTFSEKLQYLKLNHRPARIPQLVDKYEVRQYVSEKGLGWTLNELLGVYDRVDEIDFAALPRAFVLKMTNSSGRNIICRDKTRLDWDKARSQIRSWYRTNYYYYGREWAYLRIRSRIVIEKYLCDEENSLPLDYKFSCIEGKPQYINVEIDRESGHKRNIYDPDWNLLPFTLTYPASERKIARPANLEEMLEVARTLARDFFFTRVDLYSIQGRTYFGELTFFPGNGFAPFRPQEYDLYWGEKMNLANLEKF